MLKFSAYLCSFTDRLCYSGSLVGVHDGDGIRVRSTCHFFCFVTYALHVRMSRSPMHPSAHASQLPCRGLHGCLKYYSLSVATTHDETHKERLTTVASRDPPHSVLSRFKCATSPPDVENGRGQPGCLQRQVKLPSSPRVIGTAYSQCSAEIVAVFLQLRWWVALRLRVSKSLPHVVQAYITMGVGGAFYANKSPAFIPSRAGTHGN